METSKRKRICLLLLCCGLLWGLCACSTDFSKTYKKAIDTFSTGDYEAAASAFERLGNYAAAPTYAAYSRGMVLFEQGAYIEAEPYFEKSKDFMYGASRYAYCHAVGLEAAGSFAQAAETFLSLGDFEDAALHGNYCKGRASEASDSETALYAYEAAGSYADAAIRLDSLQVQVYAKAKEFMQSKEYEKALNLFGKLGDYFDSADQAKACKDFFRRELYAQAEALEKSGQLQQAYDAFKGLSGYSDAESRAEDLARRMGLPEEPEE